MLKAVHDWLIYWDFTAWYYLNTQWVNDFFDLLMPVLRNQWTWAPLYLFLLIFMPLNYGRKGWMWCVFFILAFALGDYVSASIIKPYYIRLRPCNNPYIKDIVHLLVPCGSGHSFPSSHATNHFAMGVFSAVSLRKKARWVWVVALLWAFSVAYAQIYVGVHFPGDVLIGGILGTIIGLVTGYTYNRVYHKPAPSVNET
ncbi:MAG: phosphatase PAP2 family protein [Chitinophagaceae bacterium]|nr:phosphatase PAP2 family protein [Chitinophagaceae bacterium]MCB9045756.1 phosphatase PAP2 family protein [Chitinophagales bacterium]